MKNLDLNAMGVVEMNQSEMKETDGGFLPLIIIGAALLLTSCVQVEVKNVNVQAGGNQTNNQETDSTSTNQ